MRRIITIIAAALAVTALSTTTALASGEDGHHQGDASSVYCLDGQTVTLPVEVFAEQGSRNLTEGIADTIIGATGGAFFLGYVEQLGIVAFLFSSDVNDANEFLEPGWTSHFVSKGACAQSPVPFVPPPPPDLPACYSQFQVDPGYWPYAMARELFAAGYWRPYAVAEPVSRTNLGNGYYLTCKLPVGFTVKNGAAISSGIGGQVVDSTGTIPGAVPWPSSAINYVLSHPDRMGEFVQVATRA